MKPQEEIIKNIGNAAKSLRPNATFRFNDPANSLDCLEWFDDEIPKPTDAELFAEAERITNDPSFFNPNLVT